MPVKLHVFNALIEGKKSEENRQFDRGLQVARKPQLFEGLSRTYVPDDVEGAAEPPEYKQPQVTAEAILTEAFKDAFSTLLDAEITQDASNAVATGDIVIDDVTIATKVPLAFLLRFEKQIIHLRTFIDALPVLDQAKEWHFDPARGWHVTGEQKTLKKKKTPHNHIKWAPPDPGYKQDAQVDVYFTDDRVGEWTLVEFSGALEATRKRQLLRRCLDLQAAVKRAREEANSADIVPRKIGKQMFDYLLAE